MIYAGKKVVTVAGTPEPLTSTRTPACWVKIQGSATNDGLISVVGCGVKDPYNPSSTTDNTGGIDIVGGGILEMGDSAAINYYDLNKIYIDAATSGEGVKFLYGRR